MAKVALQVRMSAETHAWLKQAAADNGCSLNGEIVERLNYYHGVELVRQVVREEIAAALKGEA
jgi:hypothetical protein